MIASGTRLHGKRGDDQVTGSIYRSKGCNAFGAVGQPGTCFPHPGDAAAAARALRRLCLLSHAAPAGAAASPKGRRRRGCCPCKVHRLPAPPGPSPRWLGVRFSPRSQPGQAFSSESGPRERREVRWDPPTGGGPRVRPPLSAAPLPPGRGPRPWRRDGARSAAAGGALKCVCVGGASARRRGRGERGGTTLGGRTQMRPGAMRGGCGQPPAVQRSGGGWGRAGGLGAVSTGRERGSGGGCRGRICRGVLRSPRRCNCCVGAAAGLGAGTHSAHLTSLTSNNIAAH